MVLMVIKWSNKRSTENEIIALIQEGRINEIVELGSRAVKPLIEGLNDTRFEIRGCCIELLGSIGDPRAVNALIERLKDNEFRISSRCAELLENIGNLRASLFKNIIYDESKEYAIEIGLKKTGSIIAEYLKLIKDSYSKEELNRISLDLAVFYRIVSMKINDSKAGIDLPKPKIGSSKLGPVVHSKLRVGT